MSIDVKLKNSYWSFHGDWQMSMRVVSKHRGELGDLPPALANMVKISPLHNGAAAGISATRIVSHSYLHLCQM